MNEVLCYSHESNFVVSGNITILYNEFEIILLNLLPNLSGANRLMNIYM